MVDPVPTPYSPNPNEGENTPPAPPSFANNQSPYGMSEPTPPAPMPPPTPEPAPAPTSDVYNGPGTTPELTVAESPFPNGNNQPNTADTPVMVRGETSTQPENFPATGPGLTTATILPVGTGGTDMVSYTSGGKRRSLLLFGVVGALILLVILAAGFLFFRQSGQQSSTQQPTTDVTETPTTEPSPPDTTVNSQVLPTTAYDNNEFNFTLDYPQSWELKEGLNGNVAAFTDMSATSPTSKITVHVESTVSDVNTYSSQLQKIYAQLYTNWVNVNTSQTTLGTIPAIQVESTYTKGATNMSVIQEIVIQGGKSFTITAEAEESAFENLRATFTQSLASLKFKS